MKMRSIGLFLTVVMIATACGGTGTATTESDAGASGSEPQTQEAKESPETPATTAASDDSGASGVAQKRAVVIVGADKYDFTMEGAGTLCTILFGVTSFGAGALVDADGNEVQNPGGGGRAATLAYFLHPDGTEPGDQEVHITVDDNEHEKRWSAGPEKPGSVISSVTIDGSVTSGSATFVLEGTSETVDGTFEIACSSG